jgi:anti-sigma B factor antagonist
VGEHQTLSWPTKPDVVYIDGTMPFETDRTTLESGILALTLSGTMTMGTQLQRFEWTVEELTRNQQNRIVVDMSAITYIDSSAIGVLVACQGMVKNAGGQLRLAGVTDRVAKILKLGGVESILLIDPTRADAVARFAPTP